MLVSQILRSKSDDGVVTLPPGTSIAKLAETLSQRRIGAVVISPDGKQVVYVKSRGGYLTTPWQGLGTGVFTVAANGSGVTGVCWIGRRTVRRRSSRRSRVSSR